MNQAIETYLATVKKICPDLTKEEEEYIRKSVVVSIHKPKDFYINAGQLQKNIGFVFKGLIRSFFINHEGKEITVRFTPENDFAIHYTAFISNTPSKYSFQCLEPSIIVNISNDTLQTAYNTLTNMNKYGRLIAEDIIMMQQYRIESFIFDNAEKRYLDFMKAYPTLYERVSLSHLSSYLGIERQSLSRIRKILTQK